VWSRVGGCGGRCDRCSNNGGQEQPKTIRLMGGGSPHGMAHRHPDCSSESVESLVRGIRPLQPANSWTAHTAHIAPNLRAKVTLLEDLRRAGREDVQLDARGVAARAGELVCLTLDEERVARRD
jgi:hypothetical protein